MRGSSCDLPKITSDDFQIAKPCVSSSISVSYSFACRRCTQIERPQLVYAALCFPCSNAAKVWHHSGTKVPFPPLCGEEAVEGGRERNADITFGTLSSRHKTFFLLYLKIITFPLLVDPPPKPCTAVLNSDPYNYSGLSFSLQYFRIERRGSRNGPQHKPHRLATKTSLLQPLDFFSFFHFFHK